MSREQKIKALEYMAKGVPPKKAVYFASMKDILIFMEDEKEKAEQLEAELQQYGIDKRIFCYLIVRTQEQKQILENLKRT